MVLDQIGPASYKLLDLRLKFLCPTLGLVQFTTGSARTQFCRSGLMGPTIFANSASLLSPWGVLP